MLRKLLESLRSSAGQCVLLAVVARGAFRAGLSKVVREIGRRHFRDNATLRAQRYPQVKSAVIWICRHPLLSLAASAFAYTMTLWLTWLEPITGPPAPDDLEDYFRDFQSINATVLGAQATFVGIVFPLVIAFVGLLNQGRASFATRLTIFVEETAAVFVGGSSLLLCIAIIVQMPLSAQVPPRVIAAATVLNILWFSMNVGALGYFIFRTIDYLHPAKRVPITQAYVANVAWRRELNDLVTENRWGNVVRYGYLPGGDEEPEQMGAQSRAQVWYSPLFEVGEPVVSKQLPGPRKLADVRLGILAPVVRAWLVMARGTAGNAGHTLVISPTPGREYKGEVVLARSTLPLGCVSRWAILAAVNFTRERRDPTAIRETSRLLKEFIADVIALIDQRQADEFSRQVGEVTDFHAFLYGIAQAPGEDFNYAQMESNWGSSLGQEWAREYRDLQRRATERLGEETEFFETCAYVGSRIYARCDASIARAGLTSLLRIPYNLFHHLMRWALAKHKAERGSGSDPGTLFELSRDGDNQGGAWRSLVSGWERLLDEIARPLRDHNNEWSQLQRIAGNLVEHLRMTTEMAGRAGWSGDSLATSWSGDLLLNWITLAERNWDEGVQAGWTLHTEAVTLEALGHKWSEIEGMTLSAVEDIAPEPRAVFAAIMRNAWRDHIIALVSICIHWSIEFGPSGSAARAGSMLLRNARHDRGDASVWPNEPCSARDVLLSILRIVGSGGRFSESSYAATFEQLAEKLDDLGDTPWVSMRIYSSSGGLGFSSLHVEHALAIMASAGQMEVDGLLRRLLLQGNDDSLRRREEYLRELIGIFDDLNVEHHGGVFVALIPDGDFDERRSASKRLVEQALAVLAEHRLNTIESAPLDQARLREVALAASADAFSGHAFPLNLFQEIDRTTAQLNAFTLRVGNQDKGAYTNPQMAVPVSNEESWWREIMRRQVARVVWSDVLRATPFQTLEGETPEAFWRSISQVSAQVRALGQAPILVVGSIMEPRWIRDWRLSFGRGAPRPADLTIHRETGQGEGYEFSLNEIRVYKGATLPGEAYVVSSALFRRVRFRDYGEGLFVAVQFQDDEANPWRGTLNAEFQRQIELGDAAAFRVRFRSSGPTQEDDA